MFYPSSGAGPCPANASAPTTMAISNVSFTGVTAHDTCLAAGQLWCDAGAPCEGVTLADVVHVGAQPASGWSCEAVHGAAVGGVSPPLPPGCLAGVLQ